jgi:hypothetical protein
MLFALLISPSVPHVPTHLTLPDFVTLATLGEWHNIELSHSHRAAETSSRTVFHSRKGPEYALSHSL